MADEHKNRTEQQTAERRHIEFFLATADLEPEAVEYGDKPDAVLVLDGRRIGLEHRELIEEDLARNERNLVHLEKRLAEEMKRLGVPGDVQVAVTVDAAADYLSKRRQVEALATSIATCAAAKAPDVTVGSSLRVPASLVAPPGALGMDLLVISRHPRLREGPYAIVSPPFWGPVDSTVLAAIEEKTAKLPSYLAEQSLDEVWLLLVTGASWVQATDSALLDDLRVPTQFDRAYVLDLRTGTVHRVDEHGRAEPE